MKKQFVPISFISLVLVFTLVSLVLSSIAQTPNVNSREAFIKTVKSRAEADAKAGKNQESIDNIRLLFGEDAATVGVSLREVVENYEATYKETKKAEPFWKDFLPKLGWITAIVIALLYILRKTVEESLTALVDTIKKKIYYRFAGGRFFRRTALRKYSEALIARYDKLIVPFRPDHPLNMREVYVPLKIKGTSDADLIDAFQTTLQNKRTMVVGLPGSGKSMLLKHITLSYTAGQLLHLNERPVPILLELNRLNDSDKTIEEHLVERLQANNFPKGESFVKLGLEQGTIILLFDGLDEVNSSKRQTVVSDIKDFLDIYDQCRVVITCRNAVYRDDFAEVVDQTLEIVDFNDQQIQRFLVSWQQYMPADKSVEQLVQALRDRPQIMGLARNPLLLTIIAFLYTDTEFILPHSRTEFYTQAVDVLLQQKKGTQNQYKAPHKSIVLQHLALFNQDKATADQQDKRSIDLKTIISEIKRTLPDLNLKEEEANPLLDEIIERSGLLLSIDAGSKYQFAHLTLQEFFAAKSLSSNQSGLLTRFKGDKDSWRETVKLWCGFDHNSTELIRGVYAEDPITAFECLADAQKVNQDLADEIINFFKTKLSLTSESDDVITKAFAAVASDARPRGEAVFNFLVDTLKNAKDTNLRKTAAAALSLTNLRKGAQILTQFYDSFPEVRSYLVRMGDLATPLLRPLALSGNRNALDDLKEIGTPQAAKVLTDMLWHADKTLATCAAINLGALLSHSNIEEELRNYKLGSEHQSQPLFNWIWKPFNEPGNSSLPTITGRIAFLLNDYVNSQTDTQSTSNIDSRIVIPLTVQVQDGFVFYRKDVFGHYGIIERITEEYFPKTIELLKEKNFNFKDTRYDFYLVVGFLSEPTRQNSDEFEELRTTFIEETLASSNQTRLLQILNFLEPKKRWKLFLILATRIKPTVDDWFNVLRPITYSFKTGWHFKLILLIAAVLSFGAIFQIGFTLLQSTLELNTRTVILVIAALSIILSWIMLWRGSERFTLNSNKFDSENFLMCCIGFLIPLFLPVMLIKEYFIDKIGSADDFIDLLYSSPFWIFTPSLIYFPTIFLLSIYSPIIVVIFWAIIAISISLLVWFGFRKDRKARNPLYGIIENQQTVSTLSI